jgi:hypothetical protein
VHGGLQEEVAIDRRQREEGGPGVEDETLVLDALDLAAVGVELLHDVHPMSLRGQAGRDSQPADAGTDHHDVSHER